MSITTVRTDSNRSPGFYALQFIRVFVGILFIFSGLIKANDPSGLAYKMQEFFELWDMTVFSPYAFSLSIAVITFEIIAGVALLLGYGFKFFSILLLLLMLFFAYLTGYAIWYEHHTGLELKCGCFGDCIPLTAMQSFLKDLLLLVLVIILLIFRKYIRPLFAFRLNISLIIAGLLAALAIQWYALRHLPFVDCLPYKTGNNIWEKMQVPPGAQPDVYETVITYEKDGKQMEISQDAFLADSTLWNLNVTDTKSKLIKKGNATPLITDFAVTDYEGNDYTEALLKEPGYNFLFFIKDVDHASLKNMDRIQKLMARAYQGEMVGFFILSSGSPERTMAFKAKYKLVADAFQLDGTVSKTAMRSNPGLMLIKGGTIIGKWSYSDFPKDFRMNNGVLEIIP